MKVISEKVFEGKNIYSHKTCIRLDLDLEGYCETPTKNIPDFNKHLVDMLPELKTHRCGIDEDGGFVKRLEEGTYLAHVCEHMIIAIQNKLGIDVAYGKAREIQGDIYYIIFQYKYKRVALNAAYLAIDIINSLINQNKINFNKRFEYLKNILLHDSVGQSTKAILEAAQKRGLPSLNLGDSGIYQIGYGKKGRLFAATLGDNTRCIGVDISCDKLLTKKILRENFIPVAQGDKVVDTIELIKIGEKIGYPLVIKPQFGNKGTGVILNIKNKTELVEAYSELKKKCDDIIIEKYVKGKDYRVCVVDYKVVAVAHRIPPYVIGNGKDTVKTLINILNKDLKRGEDHEKSLTKIKIDDILINYLDKQNLKLNSVIPEGQKLYLRENANLSTGGMAIDCTDKISEANRAMCVRVAKALGLDVCGIDICTKDIGADLKSDGVVVEVNSAPGIRMHHFPSKGKPRDVAGAIVDMMYKNNFDNIPLIAVTGTNGKTTTTRLISYVYSLKGYNVGMTTTSGIFIGDEAIDIGDDTGACSARSILINKDVDVAVLETARGGIIRQGLAYDLADVAVLTNITEDHLGIDGINTMEDLSKVKALVLEAVKPDGFAVMNADDKWSLSIVDRVKAPIIYFSEDENNQYIQRNIERGLPVVYEKNEKIVVRNNGKIYEIADIKDIPITLNGKLKYNVKNSMAACAALVAMKIDYCMIAKGITNFNGDGSDNLGRFNLFNVDGVSVVLDYGHNIDGYLSVIDGLKSMNYKSMVGIIGMPGDRSDEVITKVGEICGKAFDEIYIKEDCDRRGREIGEVAELLKIGVTKTNAKSPKIILNELDALDAAINNSKPGTLIIQFYEDFDKLSSYLKERMDEGLNAVAQSY